MRNRKSYFSINAQCLTDANLKFLDVVARWSGATHDLTIFANSAIRPRFETAQFPGCVIIGDSGYPLKNYLMTPPANPVTRGRNSIEMVFGIWKRRFPVVAYGIRLKIETVLAIIVATTVLHNMSCDMHEPNPPVPDDMNEAELNYLIDTQQIETEAQEGSPVNTIQNEIVRFFSQL
nr:unnamed protein product [Callosobruchus analis]